MSDYSSENIFHIPPCFQHLLHRTRLSPEEIHHTGDGFFALTRSLSTLLADCGISTFPNAQGEERRCDRFFDDWFLYAVAEEGGHVCSLFKMREQESDAADGIPADGDTPGVTVSFIAFQTDVLEACLSDPTAANRSALNREINRVVAARGQSHHRLLKQYFCRPQSQGTYLIARLYVTHIASFAQDGCLSVPAHYRTLYRQSKGLPASHRRARLPRFIEENNSSAGETVCDHESIRIRDPEQLTRQEALAILATHTANTSFHSFAAEVRYHACFLVGIAKLPLPFFGRSVYASAIRADMTIDDRELTGPAPYYREESRWIREQKRCHSGFPWA